jgi:hypothetical protein
LDDDDDDRDDNGRETGENNNTNLMVYYVAVLIRRRTLRCLVLVPTGNATGEYRRVGLYAMPYEEDLSIMGRGVKPYRVDPCLVDGDGRITII